jgi:hypothetical protein
MTLLALLQLHRIAGYTALQGKRGIMSLLLLILACGTPEKLAENAGPGFCTDGIDNDSDGLLDCDDPDCSGAAECQTGSGDTDDDNDSEDSDPHTDTDDPHTDSDSDWTNDSDSDPWDSDSASIWSPDSWSWDTDSSSGSLGTCENNCGGFATSCWCDSLCSTYGDCCSDYNFWCIQGGVDTDDSDDSDTEPPDSSAWTWGDSWHSDTPDPKDSSSVPVDTSSDPTDTSPPVDTSGGKDSGSTVIHSGDTSYYPDTSPVDTAE